MSLELVLYTRYGCHLCDQMAGQLQPYMDRYRFRVRMVDIDRDDELIRLYALKIPVLAHGDRVLCEYQLEEAALVRALDRLSAS